MNINYIKKLFSVMSINERNLILNNDYNFIVDMNGDQRIDVLDIIELINIIINN